MEITNYDYNRIMFMTADCVKWVETTKNNFETGWGTAGGITVTSTSEGLSEGVVVNVSYFSPGTILPISHSNCTSYHER